MFDTESEQANMTQSLSKPIDGLGPGEIQVRNILDTAMDGIISMDADQKIVLFNTAAEAIFGWSVEQVLGKSIDILIPERFHSRHHADVKHFGEEKTKNRRMATQRTVKALRANGEEFPIEASISQTTINDEKVYTVILRDVTEAVRYRQQIEQQSQMLDQVSDAVSVVNREDRITYWNQAATRLFGWTADEALGKKACELLFRGDARVLSEVMRETDARRSWNGELVKVTRSGEPVIVEHRRTVLQDETGQVKGHLCIDIDITARKKRERAAHRSQRLESIGTLAGGIAHDLNNVLTPILMGAKLLASGRIFGDRQGLLETMVASAQRGADLVTQLLAFAGGIRGERAPVCINEIVNETCKLLEHTLPKSIRISTSSPADCPPVLGDSTELSQVLMNLCINARDAMPDGGTLTIKSEIVCLDDNAKQLNPDATPGRYVLLKVSDTGIGMSPDILDRIFDPFFTTKEVGKGTGLGLATVQGIVKSHSGFINVYSEPRNGTKFMIYLPAEERFEPDTGKAEEGDEAGTRKAGRGYTVLIVDDELFILKMTATALEASGFKVITARDGAEAISTYSRHRDEIAVVLLDMMMPGLDGLQTLEHLKRVNPEVAVVACSGLRTQQREKEALERGARYFLPKPYSESQLLEVLSNILRTTAGDPSPD